jgi:hypothetical protein
LVQIHPEENKKDKELFKAKGEYLDYSVGRKNYEKLREVLLWIVFTQKENLPS